MDGCTATWLLEVDRRPDRAADLVELIESRIGAIPPSVSDVIDALAVGEPIELASLIRITDPAAVEDADTRGLITIDTVVAAWKYGWRIRSMARCAASAPRPPACVGCGDWSPVNSPQRTTATTSSRSAARHIEPRFRRRTRSGPTRTSGRWRDLARGSAVGRSARRGGDPRRRRDGGEFRSRVRLVLAQPRRAGRCGARRIPTSALNNADHARLTFLRATNRLFTLADPTGAKKLIDDASHTTSPTTRSYIDAFLTVYWAAMGKAGRRREIIQAVCLGPATRHRCPTCDGLGDCLRVRRRWPHHRSRGRGKPGYPVVTRSFDAAPAPLRLRHYRRPRRRTADVRPIVEALSVAERLAPARPPSAGNRSAAR